jgi:hypothetical protein
MRVDCTITESLNLSGGLSGGASSAYIKKDVKWKLFQKPMWQAN